MDFPLAGLIQPRTYFCYVFGESNMFQSRIATVTEKFISCIIFILLLTQIEEWVGQEECRLSFLKVKKEGEKVGVG